MESERGHGLRHDSFHQTTGFQPLFLLVIVPVYWLLRDKLLAVTAVLLLQTAIGALLGWRLHRFVRSAAGELAGTLAVACWAVSPTFVSVDLNGLETVWRCSSWCSACTRICSAS